jgi:hypothetical protein
MVDNPRMHPKAVEPNDGPYVVREVLAKGNIRLGELQGRRIKDVVNVQRLTRYYRRHALGEEEAQRPRLDRLWPVHSIVAHRITTAADPTLGRAQGERDIEYKLQWGGLDKCYSKWLARPYLHSIWELVDAYNKCHTVGEFAAVPLEAESREVGERPPVAEVTKQRHHFRPIDRNRRRQAQQHAAQPQPQPAGSKSPMAPLEQTAAAPPVQTPTATAGDSRHAERAAARAQRRQEWLESERQRREARADRLKTAAACFAAAQAFATAHEPIAGAEAPSTAGAGEMVRLVASDGVSFTVARAAALLAGTVKLALTSRCAVEGAPADEVVLAEVDSQMFAEAVRYMEYKLAKMAGTAPPRFTIAPGKAIRLFRVANYLNL